MGTVKLKLTDSTNDVVGALHLLFIQTSVEVHFSTTRSSFFALK